MVELNGIGVTGEIQTSAGAIVDWKAGGAARTLDAFDLGTRIRVHGSDFSVDSNPVPAGDLAATSGVLSGTLESGEAFSVMFYQGGYNWGSWISEGVIELVPEPKASVLYLVALGVVAWTRSRRRSCTISTQSEVSLTS